MYVWVVHSLHFAPEIRAHGMPDGPTDVRSAVPHIQNVRGAHTSLLADTDVHDRETERRRFHNAARRVSDHDRCVAHHVEVTLAAEAIHQPGSRMSAHKLLNESPDDRALGI